MFTPRMILPIMGVASDETGQPDVVLSGATEESAFLGTDSPKDREGLHS